MTERETGERPFPPPPQLPLGFLFFTFARFARFPRSRDHPEGTALSLTKGEIKMLMAEYWPSFSFLLFH